MSITIVFEKENPTLSRKEYECTVDYSGATPKKDQITDMLANKVGGTKELIVIKNVASAYGKQIAKVSAYVYSSKDMLDKLEVVKKKKAAKAAESK